MRGFGVIVILVWMVSSAAAAGEPETVTFRTLHPDAASLRGFLLKPAGSQPFPVVLLLHGVRTRRVNAGGGERTVHLGADPATRATAVARTRRWLAAWLKE